MPRGLSIVARDVGVEYDLRLTQRRTLRQVLGERIHGRRDEVDSFWALREVSFTVREGDVLGLIGRNGSGKSTLLLAVAGILKPDAGSLHTFGSTATLLTLGAGFDANLTGRENIYLNGAFLGFSRQKIDRVVSDIVDFSGLGAFIDVPLRKYSAGMRARLGFSIAVHSEPDILLLDEILGVGDEEFKQRSKARIAELIERARAIVVVSHDLGFVQETCTRCLWLADGTVADFGAPEKVVARYRAVTEEHPGEVVRVVS